MGINVDAMHENVKETKTALTCRPPFPGVAEHYLDQPAQPYGCRGSYQELRRQDIPANFLISRDGKVIALEMSGDGLERSVSQAIASGSGGAGK